MGSMNLADRVLQIVKDVPDSMSSGISIHDIVRSLDSVPLDHVLLLGIFW